YSGENDGVMLCRDRRANDAGDESEVGGQPVIESVHDVPEKSAGLRTVPRLTRAPRDLVERLRVLRGLARERERLTLTRHATRRAAVHVEVAFDLASLFGEQHRQEEPRAKSSAEHRQKPRSRAGTMRSGAASVLRQKGLPHLDVLVLDFSQAQVQR